MYRVKVHGPLEINPLWDDQPVLLKVVTEVDTEVYDPECPPVFHFVPKTRLMFLNEHTGRLCSVFISAKAAKKILRVRLNRAGMPRALWSWEIDTILKNRRDSLRRYYGKDYRDGLHEHVSFLTNRKV